MFNRVRRTGALAAAVVAAAAALGKSRPPEPSNHPDNSPSGAVAVVAAAAAADRAQSPLSSIHLGRFASWALLHTPKPRPWPR